MQENEVVNGKCCFSLQVGWVTLLETALPRINSQQTEIKAGEQASRYIQAQIFLPPCGLLTQSAKTVPLTCGLKGYSSVRYKPMASFCYTPLPFASKTVHSPGDCIPVQGHSNSAKMPSTNKNNLVIVNSAGRVQIGFQKIDSGSPASPFTYVFIGVVARKVEDH